jgi:hypothetical protein
MALTGQLSDLSLAELIEFFCNQRKTGRLKVSYAKSPGYFYFQRGELVDAKIGSLVGVEAVYYALTQANASFKFSAAIEPSRRSIHQPWASVALEGLRRMDEGIVPGEPVYDNASRDIDPDETDENREKLRQDEAEEMPFSLTMDRVAESAANRNKVVYAGVAAAVLLSVAAIGVPAGWYKSKATPAPVATSQPTSPSSATAAPSVDPSAAQPSSTQGSDLANSGSLNDAGAAARREREARDRERQRADDRANAAERSQAAQAAKAEAAKPAQKMVSVQVTYDENGRVTQTSGGDGMAQRIARQKRFPAGKAGSITISIPVN